MRLMLRFVLFLVVICLLYPLLLAGLFFFAPSANASLYHVDTLIVLGCPAKPDGSPTPEQRERVLESVREFQKGVSRSIIMTGGAAHNHFVEAHTMALLAEAQGVPASAIVEETQAHDTVQNIYYSAQIMRAHGWRSTEVISSPYHLPRTALILQHYPQLQWETHAARWPPEYHLWQKLLLDQKEARTSFHIRTQGFRPSPYLPQ